jgi:hypothetical protein
MMDSPHLNKKKPLAILHLMRCSMGILGEITRNELAFIDAGQNISDFNKNNNTISVGYRWIRVVCPTAVRQNASCGTTGIDQHLCRTGKKKGAQRAPLTPTESLWVTTRSHHHKTRVEYGYLSPAAP